MKTYARKSSHAQTIAIKKKKKNHHFDYKFQIDKTKKQRGEDTIPEVPVKGGKREKRWKGEESVQIILALKYLWRVVEEEGEGDKEEEEEVEMEEQHQW